MKKYVLLLIILLRRAALMVVLVWGNGILSLCDITDVITKQVSNQALTVWALLELAEHEHIADHVLFYDELCKTTLKLCKEVQQLKESGYALNNRHIHCFGQLFNHLHIRFRALPDYIKQDQRYINAIDVILEYADYFLKYDLSIDAYGETAHARL